MKAIESLRARLVREGRGAWKLWSNQFAVLVGVVAAWAVENPTVVMGYISEIGQPWRSFLTFMVAAGLPIMVRMARQPKLQPKPEEAP